MNHHEVPENNIRVVSIFVNIHGDIRTAAINNTSVKFAAGVNYTEVSTTLPPVPLV
jgi:hypothetical protein